MARKLKLFRITGDLTNLDPILKKFVHLDCVHPIPSKDFISQVHGLTSIPTENPWQDIYMELEETEKETNLKIDPA
ncbi:MAG TPA: V-type ATP synthase subunit I, partial [Bacillota bacterium]|nr:V-type ATP synthase subunit I [Bacillota bacterium]